VQKQQQLTPSVAMKRIARSKANLPGVGVGPATVKLLKIGQVGEARHAVSLAKPIQG